MAGSLVDAVTVEKWLAEDPRPLILDCRHRLRELDWGRKAYRDGHLPGALHLHLDDDLSGALVQGPLWRKVLGK